MVRNFPIQNKVVLASENSCFSFNCSADIAHFPKGTRPISLSPCIRGLYVSLFGGTGSWPRYNHHVNLELILKARPVVSSGKTLAKIRSSFWSRLDECYFYILARCASRVTFEQTLELRHEPALAVPRNKRMTWCTQREQRKKGDQMSHERLRTLLSYITGVISLISAVRHRLRKHNILRHVCQAAWRPQDLELIIFHVL